MEQQQEREYYPIFKIDAANFLIRRGHDLKYITDDENNNYYKVMWFKDTESFHADLHIWSERTRKKKEKRMKRRLNVS